jgi:hypothetical protein
MLMMSAVSVNDLEKHEREAGRRVAIRFKGHYQSRSLSAIIEKQRRVIAHDTVFDPSPCKRIIVFFGIIAEALSISPLSWSPIKLTNLQRFAY